jgi:hypothetical protein
MGFMNGWLWRKQVISKLYTFSRRSGHFYTSIAIVRGISFRQNLAQYADAMGEGQLAIAKRMLGVEFMKKS